MEIGSKVRLANPQNLLEQRIMVVSAVDGDTITATWKWFDGTNRSAQFARSDLRELARPQSSDDTSPV